ncbi:hypothetical protein [Luteirhabdus pelagi]|jgi:hypothetical protein|uniref:hypothetical protein n=1 Tax=Luteirhabdus pelagi TaxID=2792783 RepID=UPI00193AD438|nr:hypothetical protein [Luteirhabdus pelagi]
MPILRFFIIFSLLCTVSGNIFSQTPTSVFGRPTGQELNAKEFPSDPDAAAVILYESANFHFEMANDRLRLMKDIYRKIKVLDAKRFDMGTIKVFTYEESPGRKEYVRDVKAVTHNGIKKSYLKETDVYEKELDNHHAETVFALADIQDGSVLEYTYTIESPFYFAFEWSFQNPYPTLYSEFKSSILGNLKYNRSLVGNHPLDINEATIEKNCLTVGRGYSNADCEAAHYAIANLPAYKEEPYMLSEDNYISTIRYELRDLTDFTGVKDRFSRSWKDMEHEIKTDKDVGRQLRKNSFVANQMPESIFEIKDTLEKAKAIYSFIQNYFSWDGKTSLFRDSRVKQAFSEGRGSVSEINLALVNALQAADLDAHMMLSASRDRRIPTDIYPVITDFNYVTAFLRIDESEYLLDASDKLLAFGMLPERALNSKGRVMDFDKGSYWKDIKPNSKNMVFLQSNFTITPEGNLEGKAKETYSGHEAYEMRTKLLSGGRSSYRERIESEISGIELSNLQFQNETNIEEPLLLEYDIFYESEQSVDKIYFNPFLLQRNLRKNPFSNETRQFPIDFGHPFRIMYLVSMELGDSYTVETLPENRTIRLEENAEVGVFYQQNGNKVSIRLMFRLEEYQYSEELYEYVRNFFQEAITLQEDAIIVLNKNSSNEIGD